MVHIVTVPVTLRFLSPQLNFLRSSNYRISVISSPGPGLPEFSRAQHVDAYGVPMTREFSPIRDVIALLRLVLLLRKLRPQIVHTHTPKAGLLGTCAAAICGIPIRVYHLRGLPMLTAEGWRRWLLRTTEAMSCRMAHRVLCVSHSIRDIAVSEHVCHHAKARVLGNGSGQGVDSAGQFNPSLIASNARELVRERLEIPTSALVIGFCGRLVGDKGVRELVHAFTMLKDDFRTAFLLIVGPVEARDAIPRGVMESIQENPRIISVGPVWEMAPMYAAMDVFALPSYREGFPNVILEAAAMELPVITTCVPGCIDAIVDGVTGRLVPPRNPQALASALRQYLSDPDLRIQHGQAGRRRVMAEFRPEQIMAELAQEYEALVQSRLSCQ